jgi:fused signal recognition particle receptor
LNFLGAETLSIFSSGLSKTRDAFFGRLNQLLGSTEIDEDTWEDIEAILIQADLGVETTKHVMAEVRERVERKGVTRTEQIQKELKVSLRELLKDPPELNLKSRPLSIILIVGVNGSGKTTSIAKLAHRFTQQRRKVMLAAGDTFRAAAIDQLKTWGERIKVPVVANQPGSDPAALVFDATNAAKARGYDLLIIDTAGRLHTNTNLMEELSKIRSVTQKIVPDAPHEVLLVLDGTTGQNALQQAQKFREVVDVTGVVVTKLDGTAKGGMVFAVFQELGLPVQFLGLGEGMDDLQPFKRDQFVNSLFEKD